jgi:hypothetical protein
MKMTELLRKTAELIKTQELEKVSLKKKFEDTEKEAEINRTVISMLKGDFIDVSDIESKIAEFKSNPDMLKKAVDFYEKSAEIGSVHNAAEIADGKAEDYFFNSLNS